MTVSVKGRLRAEQIRREVGGRIVNTKEDLLSAEIGDAAMWDNTGSLHRAMPGDPDCGRLLHRTIITGDSWG